MSFPNPAEPYDVILPDEDIVVSEKRKNDAPYAPYSRRFMLLMSLVLTPIVGAFMLAENYDLLRDRKTATSLRLGFLVGVPAFWLFLVGGATPFMSQTHTLNATLLAFVIPLVALDWGIGRWNKAWTAIQGETTIGTSSTQAWLYAAIALVVAIVFESSAPPTGIGLVNSLVSNTPTTTFVDGSFSMSYPSEWQTGKLDIATCAWMECVQTFTLPKSLGSISIVRSNSFLYLMGDLEAFGSGAIVALSTMDMTLKDTRHIQLDGHEAIQYNFTLNNLTIPTEGVLIIARTPSELYQIIGISIPNDFALIEQALGTIQLDVEE